MALRHKLQLDILPTQSPNVLVVQDISLYVAGLDNSAGVLDILPPGAEKSVKIITGITPGFTRIVHPHELGWGTLVSNSTVPRVIPDGVFVISYYLMPGDIHWVRRKYLRVANLQVRLDNLLVRYYSNVDITCLPLNYSQQQISLAREFAVLPALLSAAQAKVASGEEDAQALELYDYVCERVGYLESQQNLCAC